MSIKIFLHFGIDNGYIFSKGINYSVRDRFLLPKLDIIYNIFLLISFLLTLLLFRDCQSQSFPSSKLTEALDYVDIYFSYMLRG